MKNTALKTTLVLYMAPGCVFCRKAAEAIEQFITSNPEKDFSLRKTVVSATNPLPDGIHATPYLEVYVGEDKNDKGYIGIDPIVSFLFDSL